MRRLPRRVTHSLVGLVTLLDVVKRLLASRETYSLVIICGFIIVFSYDLWPCIDGRCDKQLDEHGVGHPLSKEPHNIN